MSIVLTMPQGELLAKVVAAGATGVLKSTGDTSARKLVEKGYCEWAAKFSNGVTGKLVATQAGRNFRGV